MARRISKTYMRRIQLRPRRAAAIHSSVLVKGRRRLRLETPSALHLPAFRLHGIVKVS